jgi:PrgI family protein
MYNMIMKFEVPQFIEIEDKIFGPLTWRQFLYLGGGVGMGVVLFFTTPFIIFLIIGLPLALLAGALAFYPVNNRPFSFFLEALINYLRGHKLYLWKRKESEVHKYSFTPSQAPDKINPLSKPNSGENKNLSSLARRLELEALQKKE